jgi:anti-sigma regulatory factor (Ser/Thr protein kinase)
MAATAPRFDRMIPAAPDAVGALRRELRRWARRSGAPAGVQERVALAFSEACAMIVGPGPGPDHERGPLVLQSWIDDDELGIRVSHRSRGVPAPPQEVGYGFGLALMAGLCDRFEVRRRDDRPGTALLMMFRLEPDPEPESAPEPEPERSSRLQPSRSSLRR